MECISINSERYPAKLREIPKPPEMLWLEGSLPSPDVKTLAVVGSRALSSYGKHACESLIEGLSGYPISIVSGLALGADACAHRAALRSGLHTLAIPGSGLGERALYPRANHGLANQILEAGGALLSEHPPEYEARAYDFPSRNRIMVGICDAVLVIEAGMRSGTLITARLAGEYNRDLLCVPHRIGDAHGFGSHLFLRLGAALVSEPTHILDALGITPNETPSPIDQRTLTSEEQILYGLLEEPHTRDELVHLCSLPPHQALSLIGILDLKGIVEEKYGKWQRVR